MSHVKISYLTLFKTYLKLGLTCFGGPVAHVAYFRETFVEKMKWLTEKQFAELIAISQFLPGPASSQLGYSIGLIKGGALGGILAFLSFTLPSALLMFLAAIFLPKLSGEMGDALVHGLKLVAVPIVLNGILNMRKKLCPDLTRILIAVAAALMIIFIQQVWMQLAVVAFGAVIGWAACRNISEQDTEPFEINYGLKTGWLLLSLFFVLLFGLPVWAQVQGGGVAFVDAFYRAGALVFGGGHVVLPLLEESVVRPGWITQDEFLAGYGAAQAVPGPMFSFASYLGTLLPNGFGGALGASLALGSIFVPGFLLMTAMLPLWAQVGQLKSAARAIAGVNAAVIGLLAAALYDPVWTSSVHNLWDLGIATIGFALIFWLKRSALWVVAWSVLSSILLYLFFL